MPRCVESPPARPELVFAVAWCLSISARRQAHCCLEFQLVQAALQLAPYYIVSCCLHPAPSFGASLSAVPSCSSSPSSCRRLASCCGGVGGAWVGCHAGSTARLVHARHNDTPCFISLSHGVRVACAWRGAAACGTGRSSNHCMHTHPQRLPGPGSHHPQSWWCQSAALSRPHSARAGPPRWSPVPHPGCWADPALRTAQAASRRLPQTCCVAYLRAKCAGLRRCRFSAHLPRGGGRWRFVWKCGMPRRVRWPDAPRLASCGVPHSTKTGNQECGSIASVGVATMLVAGLAVDAGRWSAERVSHRWTPAGTRSRQGRVTLTNRQPNPTFPHKVALVLCLPPPVLGQRPLCRCTASVRK